MPVTSPIRDRLKPDTIIQNNYGGHGDSSPRFILGYWSTRCLGAPIRMMLSAAQVNHWVLMYDAREANGDDASWDKSSWWLDKEWLKKEFPLINLPFLVDCANQRVLSQTNAISLYLGRELNRLGSKKEEVSLCEELLENVTDLRNIMLDFAYKTNQVTCREDAVTLLRNASILFEKLELHLMQQYPDTSQRKSNHKDIRAVGCDTSSVCHLIAGQFTVPDFHLWEILDQYEGLCRRFKLPNCLGDSTICSEPMDATKTGEQLPQKTTIFPYLKEFKDSFIRLPANSAYCARFGLNGVVLPDVTPIQLPYNNSYARFGSCPDPCDVYVRGQETPWRNRGVCKAEYKRIVSGIED